MPRSNCAGKMTLCCGRAATTVTLRTGCFHKEVFMKWEKPAASDIRFGFEITMYIANR